MVRRVVIRVGLIAFAVILLLPAAYVFLAFHPEWVDGRYRTYKRFYRDLQPGMTRAQVMETLDQRYPAGGPRQRPTIMDNTPTRLGFFMNPEHSREPNCEGIFLTFEGGRLSKIVYSPD